jgi:hypothetical protein
VSKKDSDSKQSNDLPLNFLSSEEMFNHAFEYAPIGMTIVGPKGDFWNANQAVIPPLLGASASRIV